MAQTVLSLWGAKKAPEPEIVDAPEETTEPTETERERYPVTLRVDPGKLASVKRKVHPFFQLKKPVVEQDTAFSSDQKQLDKQLFDSNSQDANKLAKYPQQSQQLKPLPPSHNIDTEDKSDIKASVKVEEKKKFPVILRIDPQKLAMVRRTVHPFFQAKKYTAPQQTAKFTHKRKASWSHKPVPHVTGPESPHINRLKRRIRQESELVSSRPPRDPKLPSFQLRPVKKAKRSLVDTKPKSAFDMGKYERQMWCQKYAPQLPRKHVNPEGAHKVASWIKSQFENLKSKRPQPVKRKRSQFDFVVDDDEVDSFKPFLVIYGPKGSGKTSAVYTACSVFNALVLECNVSSKRSGAQLKEMLTGVTQSHVVHADADKSKWYHCCVLIDEADINLDQEGTFWPTLKEFAYKSRRPIVLTCESCDDIPLNVINSETSEFVYMPTPDAAQVAETAFKVCTSEGFLVDRTALAKIVMILKCDMRQILTHLQFWLQWGVGGSLAGGEWFAKAHEQGKRVVSLNNYIEVPPFWQPASEPTTLADILKTSEHMSMLDSIGDEQQSSCYLKDVNMKPIDLYYLFNDYAQESETQLVVELLPFVRDIARGDLERASASAGLRGTRRSLASFGLRRQVLDNPRQVLETFSIP